MTRQRRPRQHSDAHLNFIRSLPCLVCPDDNDVSTEAAHIRFSCARLGKRYVGKGEKADDAWVIPLCGFHHHEQHKVGEVPFWLHFGRGREKLLFPVIVANALWRVSGDYQAGWDIIREWRQ